MNSRGPIQEQGSEEARIQGAYARRQGDAGRYTYFSAGNLFIEHEYERKVLRLLKHCGRTDLSTARILEIGCGDGSGLRDFLRWGAEPENLVGLDLLPESIARAKRRCPGAVELVCGSARRLDFADASFDVVLQATVFTSILDGALRQQVAREMLRVLRPDGLILWYDFHCNNPRNPDVRGVKRREIYRLFPGCAIRLQRVTLAPPLVRRLAPYSWLLCHLLTEIRFLCTHYLGVIGRNRAQQRFVP